MRESKVEWAAALGFKSGDAEQAIAILDAFARSDDLDVVMDLARFVKIPLPDAAMALLVGRKRLRRLGLDADNIDEVRPIVAGQAALYAKTFYGQIDVREAQGHTFTKVFTDLVERWFGPR